MQKIKLIHFGIPISKFTDSETQFKVQRKIQTKSKSK